MEIKPNEPKIGQKKVEAVRQEALQRRYALQNGEHIPILDPAVKGTFSFPMNYGHFNMGILPTSHAMATCFSQLSRYSNQIEEVRNRMIAKRNGPLKVLVIGVAQGQEPLTHINTAYELSKNSAKTISDFLDLRTVDVLTFAPQFSHEARKLNPAVVSHLEHIYDPRSKKSIWETPIEEAAGKLLESGEKQDVILFNNVIQHMCPDSDETLEKTFEQLADLVNDKGIICAEVDDYVVDAHMMVRDRLNLFHKVMKDKNFIEISKNIFEKQ